jgi:hypothetical protein
MIAYLDLEFPSFYTDWEVALERPIAWWAFNVAGDVMIELFLEGAGKVADIGVAPAGAGQFNWSPQASGISGDTFHRYRIHVTSLADSSVTAQSRESFAIPLVGNDFYVDDTSNDDDEYTPTAIGNNRGTGKTSLDPKANPLSVFNSYDIDGGETIHVDTGAHLLVRDVVLSGQANLGAHEGVVITRPIDTSKVASFTVATPACQCCL